MQKVLSIEKLLNSNCQLFKNLNFHLNFITCLEVTNSLHFQENTSKYSSVKNQSSFQIKSHPMKQAAYNSISQMLSLMTTITPPSKAYFMHTSHFIADF
jgi:hypothetical protein